MGINYRFFSIDLLYIRLLKFAQLINRNYSVIIALRGDKIIPTQIMTAPKCASHADGSRDRSKCRQRLIADRQTSGPSRCHQAKPSDASLTTMMRRHKEIGG